MSIRSVTVFSGSTPGTDPVWVESARSVGSALARKGIRVVYGGGGGGLMGGLADGVLAEGGEVIGVIPTFMIDREWGRDDLTELHVVETMHQRKALMANLADAFLVLPGGIGTLEEFFEVWTWRQIGLLDKPVGLLDTNGFWQPTVAALQGITEHGFMRERTMAELVVGDDLEEVLARLEEQGGSAQLLRPGS